MLKRTALYERHLALRARMVDFGGFEMPLAYGSQIEEHHAVRRAAGVFDVSHMRSIDVRGQHATAFLRRLLANDVARLVTAGKALYTCMLNEQGGVIDDLIAYRRSDVDYRLVVNAATAEKDLAWMHIQGQAFGVAIADRTDLGLLAVQGPQARELAAHALGEDAAERALALARFQGQDIGDGFVGRTGYTGEDGFEIALPNGQIGELFERLLALGVRPCGLGARDTLRLEAGLNLYGQDMDEQTTPLEAGLAWTVAFEPEERAFIGRQALEAQRQRSDHARMVGLVLEGPGVLRNDQPVLVDRELNGRVLSGSFGPTTGRSIGFARLSGEPEPGAEIAVEIRGRAVPARACKPPFVGAGRSLIEPSTPGG